MRDLVALELFSVVPYPGVTESPKGVERVALHESVHHKRVVSARVCHGDIFRGSDVVHILPVVGYGEVRGPCEVAANDVAALNGKFGSVVGGVSEVHEMGVESGLGSHLHIHKKVSGLGDIGLGRDIEPAVEEGHIGRDIVKVRLLPGEVRAWKLPPEIRRRLASSEYVALGSRGEHLKASVSVNRIVSGASGAEPE